MFRLLYSVTSRVDYLLATDEQRRASKARANYMRAMHGGKAFDELYRKLRDPRRTKSRREIRLAVALLVANDAGPVAGSRSA